MKPRKSETFPDLVERRKLARPDEPIKVPVASAATLATRVREVGRAWRAGDEPAARYELAELAREDRILSLTHPLWSAPRRDQQLAGTGDRHQRQGRRPRRDRGRPKDGKKISYVLVLSLDLRHVRMEHEGKIAGWSGGRMTSLNLYLDSSSAAGRAVVGIYASRNGHPAALLDQATIASVTPGSRNSIPVPSLSVTAGQRLWIAVLGPKGAGTIRFRDALSLADRARKRARSTTWPPYPRRGRPARPMPTGSSPPTEAE